MTSCFVNEKLFLPIAIRVKSGPVAGAHLTIQLFSPPVAISRGINYYSCTYPRGSRDISILLVVQAVVTPFIGPDAEATEETRFADGEKKE